LLLSALFSGCSPRWLSSHTLAQLCQLGSVAAHLPPFRVTGRLDRAQRQPSVSYTRSEPCRPRRCQPFHQVRSDQGNRRGEGCREIVRDELSGIGTRSSPSSQLSRDIDRTGFPAIKAVAAMSPLFTASTWDMLTSTTSMPTVLKKSRIVQLTLRPFSCAIEVISGPAPRWTSSLNGLAILAIVASVVGMAKLSRLLPGSLAKCSALSRPRARSKGPARLIPPRPRSS
jgi:hypothetical protein